MTASLKKIGGGGSGAPSADAAAYYESELRPMDAERREEARAKPADPSRRADDYMAADPSAPLARWWSVSDKLAPNGAPILPGQLRAALDGKDLNGKRLVQDAARGNRVGGWDMTFSAPKSVSALWATADAATRRAIMEDVAASAAAALHSLHDAGAFITRTGKAGTVHEKAADVAVALFPQATSRAGQPQLHCHSVIANAARRADGSTGALHSPALYAWKTAAGATFRAELAHRLERRGLAIEADGRAFKVAGVSEALCFVWSKRRQQIVAVTPDASLSGKAKRIVREKIAQATRQAKNTLPRTADLERMWRDTLDTLSLSPAAVWAQAREAAAGHRRPDLAAGDAALKAALDAHSVVTGRELRRLVAEATQTRGGGAAAAKAEFDRLMRDGPLLELGRTQAGETVHTTRAVLDRERRMLWDVLERRGAGSIIRADAAEAAISARPMLSAEQAAAVRHAARGDGVVVVEGTAGAGKSYALAAVVEAARASGARVVGLAPSHAAKHVLRDEAGIADADTLQGFLADLHAGRVRFGAPPPVKLRKPVEYLGREVVILVDEAGMAGSADLAALLRITRDCGAQVRLIGDRRQLRNPTPGDAFAAVADALGVSRLAEPRRQEAAWMRAATRAFSSGDSPDGLARYEARGRIRWAGDDTKAVQQAVDAWQASRVAHPEASRLLLASTNTAVHALNAEVRGRLIAAGELGAEAITARTRHSGGPNGEGEARDMELRQGDQLAIGATLTGAGHGITAGDLATLSGITSDADPLLTLRLDRTGETMALRLSDLAGRGGSLPVLQHAYARTVHKSQGATADYVIVHAGAGLDAARAYVAATRHRKDVLIVADRGVIAESLQAEGVRPTREAVRDAFLRRAKLSGDGQNAADYVADRAAWLRTGDPLARSSETREAGILHRAEADMLRHRYTAMREAIAAQEAAQRAAMRQAAEAQEAARAAAREAAKAQIAARAALAFQPMPAPPAPPVAPQTPMAGPVPGLRPMPRRSGPPDLAPPVLPVPLPYSPAPTLAPPEPSRAPAPQLMRGYGPSMG